MSKIETQTEKLAELVAGYFAEHKESPFKHFESKEDDQMAVDLDSEFEKIITEEFQDKTSEVLSAYISEVIRNLIDNLDEAELEELEETKEK